MLFTSTVNKQQTANSAVENTTMSSQDHLHTLMTEVGPRLNLLELTEFEDDASWRLLFDEQTLVMAEYVADEDRLVLSANIATPDANTPSDRLRIYEQLLQYNYHWELTGSVRMALEGPGGELVQLADLRVSGLDLETLTTALSGFQDKVQGWREALAATASRQAPDQPDNEPPVPPGVRV